MKRRKDCFLRSLTGDRPEARVSVEFTGLPQDSRLKLDEALRAWATWHADRFLPGYVPPETVSGKLGYAPDTMRLLPGDGEEAAGGGAAAAAAAAGGRGGEAAARPGGGSGGAAFVWEDLPAAPAKSGVETMWFNVTYEQVGDVPKYDRSSASLSYSARKRRASEGLLAAAEGEGVGKPVAKKRRGGNRCFNCGSYGHTLRECWREHNKALVEENKRELAESKPAGYRSAPRRYYLAGATPGSNGGPAEQVEGEFEGLAPGQLSEELRAALGIGLLAPPPWLQRMRELGLPPGYFGPVPAAAAVKKKRAEQQAAAPAPGAGGEEDGLGDFVALSPEEDTDEDAEWECTVQFPGVNAPAPEGADPTAWGLPSRQHHAQQAQQGAAGTPAAGLPHGFGTPRPEGRGSERGSRDRSSERGSRRGRDRSSERVRERSSERRSRRRSRERSQERGSRHRSRERSHERSSQWDRERSRERASKHAGGSGSGWQPLRGLHPPRHSEHAEGGLQAVGGIGGAQPYPGAASAPGLLSYQPHQQQLQQAQPGMPPLPPGFGAQQQQQERPQLPLAAGIEVYRTSQSDPGHLLAAQHHQQQAAWGWGQQYAQQPAYQQQVAYGQQLAYPRQLGWSQGGYPQPQAAAAAGGSGWEPHGASPGGLAGNGWQQGQQQRSLDHQTQQQTHHQAQQGQEMTEEQRRRWRQEQQRLWTQDGRG